MYTQTGLPKGNSCDICHKIVEAVHSDTESSCRKELGTIAELLQSSCQTHDPLLRPWAEGIVTDSTTPDYLVILAKPHRAAVELCFDVRRPDAWLMCAETRNWAWVKACGIPDLVTGLVVNTEWTALKVVQSWYKRCATHHDCCTQRANWQDGLDVAPNWMVDVAAGCLVKGRLGAQYVTLSYVWVRGKSPDTSCGQHAETSICCRN